MARLLSQLADRVYLYVSSNRWQLFFKRQNCNFCAKNVMYRLRGNGIQEERRREIPFYRGFRCLNNVATPSRQIIPQGDSGDCGRRALASSVAASSSLRGKSHLLQSYIPRQFFLFFRVHLMIASLRPTRFLYTEPSFVFQLFEMFFRKPASHPGA